MGKRERGVQGVTKEQLRAGEEGLTRILFAKRFSREWIERHVPEVMGQAQADLADRLAVEHVHDAVALLVVIAYRRALKIVRAEASNPRTVSLEEKVIHLADESAKTPEQEVVDNERQARLLQAIGYLPDREKKLLGLVYFGGLTVKDAGQELGWSPSSAVRHERAALEKLRALVGERSLLEAEIGLAAFAASDPLKKGQLAGWLEGAVNHLRELAAVATQRWAPVADAGNAIAIGGAGRTTAGVCGLAVAACLTAVGSGVVGPGVGALDPSSQRPEPRAAAPKSAEPTDSLQFKRAIPPRTPIVVKPSRFSGTRVTDERHRDRHLRPPSTKTKRNRDARPAPTQARAADEQAIDEFGVEGGAPEANREPAPVADENSSPIRSASPAPAPPSPAAGGNSSGGGGSQTPSEFGM